MLADASRRRILEILRQGDRTVGELVDQIGLSQPAVSKHLRVLREADLVGVVVDGQRRRYHLKTQPLRQLETWLQPFRELWSDHLDALEDHLDRKE